MKKVSSSLDPSPFIRNFIAETLKKLHPNLKGNLIKILFPLSMQ